MKIFFIICVIFIGTLCSVSSSTIDLKSFHQSIDKEPETLQYEGSIDNIELEPEKRRPFLQLINTMEDFIENSMHTVFQEYILKNSTFMDNLSQLVSSPLQSFHNFTVKIGDIGDTIFKRQEKIIHLVQCECPDEDNKCNHILARKTAYDNIDENREVMREGHRALPIVDVVELVKHFQLHFANVLQTQRKVFEYAQCACPNKQVCMKTKAANGQIYKNLDEEEIQEKVNTRFVRSAGNNNQGRGFFSDHFSWLTDWFGNDKVTHHSKYPNGTQYYNGILPDGSHFTGGEYHDGNSNGYFLSSVKNDSNGYFASSSSGSSSVHFGKKK